MPRHERRDGTHYWTRVAYVIELDPSACDQKGSPCGGGCGKTPVYVGETALTPDERFEQHLNGNHASRWVKRYGLHLGPYLSGGYGEMATQDASLAAEAEQARRLANRRGGTKYCVYGVPLPRIRRDVSRA